MVNHTIIVAYGMFPYQRVIGGSTRALGFYQSIIDSGYKAVIFSAQRNEKSGYFGFNVPQNTIYLKFPKAYNFLALKSDSVGNVNIKNRSSIFRKYLKVLQNEIGFRDLSILLSRNLEEEIKSKYFEGYRNIIYTAPPYWLVSSVMKIKKIYGSKINVILDIRDSWTKHMSYYTKGLSRIKDRKIRFDALKHSDAITCATLGIKDELNKSLQSLNIQKQVTLIENGYFLKDKYYMEKSLIKKTDKPLLLFSGSKDFEGCNQNILNNFLETIEILRHNCIFDVVFCGNINKSKYFTFLEKQKIIKSIVLPHKKLLKLLKRATILMVINEDIHIRSEVMRSKTYEYIAAKKPILVVGYPNSPVWNLVRDLRIGEVADIRDKEQIKNSIIKLLKEQENEFKYPLDENKIFQFSREYNNKKLLLLLK